MPARIIAEATQTRDCPLYEPGAGLVFDVPAVSSLGLEPVCSLAVERLLPLVRKIRKGKDADRIPETACPGCHDGSAWFTFHREDADTYVLMSSITSKAQHALTRSRVFQGTSVEALRRAFPLFEEVALPAGSVLIQKNGPVDGLYVIVDGEFEILQPDEDGNLTVVAEVGPGECLGEISIITGERASAAVRSKGRARLVMVKRERVPELMACLPLLPGRLAQILASRLIGLTQRFQKEVARGLKGRLEAISPTELVQTLAVSNLSGMLRVEGGSREVLMTFHNGRIGEIRLDELSGEEAFYEFLSWIHGEFRFEPGQMEGVGTMDAMSLLLEGMRRLDETRRLTPSDARLEEGTPEPSGVGEGEGCEPAP